MTAKTNRQWQGIIEEHELACFQGELATSSPESYTIDEMREISEHMDASAAEVEAAIREGRVP